MSLTITRANDVILTSNLIVTIYGEPGIGKTSLGFSAKNPLLLDFDQGAQRSIGRKDAVIIKSWNDIEGLDAQSLAGFDTIIIDTVGRLLEVLAAFLVVKNPKLARSTGELQLQGYGALNTAFKAFLTKLKSFNKDIILIGHSKEDKENEVTFTRIDAMGSSKSEITKCSDLLGYLYAKDSQRHIDFNPTQNHLGKNCAEIPLQSIPQYSDNKAFLAELIEKTKSHMNAQGEEQIKAQKSFDNALAMIDEAHDVETINGLVALEYVANSPALKQKLHAKALELGLKGNKETKQYEIAA